MFDTEDDDFSLLPNSKLSAIFGAPAQDTSASLSYQAPKQPKASENTAKTPSDSGCSEAPAQAQSSVMLARVVTLWKLDNGKNNLMGKYMVALIHNSTTNLQDIIVYQDKTKILIRLPLKAPLSFYKYPNNFVAFYDATRQLWNMNFDDLQGKNDFLGFVAKLGCNVIEQNNTNTDNNSINNNNVVIESEDSSKEKILSRVSKMGQQILPKTEINANISDSESDLSSDSLPHKPLAPLPRKFKRNLGNQERALAPMTNDNYHNLMPNNNQMMLNNPGLMYSQPDYGFNSFIIAQNAELKANLAEINSKLNNVLGNNSSKNCNNENPSMLKSKIKLQNLKIENLTKDLNKNAAAFEDLLGKYMELDCKRKMYESVDIELAALKGNVVETEGLKNEVKELKKQLEEFELKIINYEALIDKSENELKEKDKKIEILGLKLKDFEDYYKENESAKKENDELKQQLEELTRKVDEGKLNTSDNSAINKDFINKLVKEGMNQAYANIMANFEDNDEEFYSFSDIRRALSENLKKTTYELMNSLSESNIS